VAIKCGEKAVDQDCISSFFRSRTMSGDHPCKVKGVGIVLLKTEFNFFSLFYLSVFCK